MATADASADESTTGRRAAWQLLACLMALAVAAWAPPARAIAPADCARMLSQVTAEKAGKDAIEKAQRQLTALKFDPQIVDGMLGPFTREALRQFCLSAKYAVSNDLLEMLRSHATIARAYPDWTTILGSSDFASWAERQADAKTIPAIKASGDAAKVIAVLDRYRKYKPFVPTVRLADDALYSYALSEDDFKQLKSTDGLLARIGQLQGKPFENPDDFGAALEAAFKSVVEPDRFIQLVRTKAEPEPALMLSEKSLNALKAKGVPPYVLQAIQPLQGLTYAEGEIEDALAGALDPIAAKIAALEPKIAKLAELSPTGARLTAASRNKFAEANKEDPVAEALLERLQRLEIVEYQNDKTMAKALKNVLAQEVERMNEFVPEIVDAAENVTSYSLSEDALAEIKDELSKFLVPEIYLQLIGDMKGVDFPDGELLWLAMKNNVSIAMPNNALRRVIFGRIEKHASTEVDQAMLDKLKGEVPPGVVDLLGGLLGKRFGDTKLLEDEVDRMFSDLASRFETFKFVVLAQARKRHVFDKSKTIQWSGASCNCVHQNLAGEVYGFYPYWLAGEKQNIDFSVLTRVGFYALGFDDKGGIPEAARWSEQDASFIKEARRYGSKVDLVVRRSDWESWNGATATERAAAFDQLAANVVRLLAIPLDDFSSSAEPYVSLGLSPQPVRGDGVTLEFGNYPQDAESVGLFIGFIRSLGAKLRALDRRFSVNLVFRSFEIGAGIYDYSKLLAFLDEIQGSEGGRLDGLFLVLLQEPTTDDKKALRVKIENGVHGRDRMKLLRAVATVLTFSGNERQLVDDVIYANDNFAGTGFWTQPFSAGSSPMEGIVAKALHRNYLKVDQGSVQEGFSVCRFVCPNKWLFRTAFDFFALALLLASVLYFSLCGYRTLFDKYFLWFLAGAVAPFILIGIALLACDPGWAPVSRGNGLLILVVVGVVAYAVWSYFERKRKAELP